jgi:excisionase family DNA binding protein
MVTIMPNQSLPLDESLTTREVALYLGLAVRSVQLMVDRGELVAWKTAGGHRRIARASLQAWLQQHRPDASLPVQTGEVAIATAQARRRASDSKQPCVVVIDDSSHFQRLISLMLGKLHPNWVVHVAGDAISGLALCGAVKPNLLICDILLPGIDGATLINSIRTQHLFQGLELLVVTSLSPDQRQPYAFALDGIHVIEKKDIHHQLAKALESFKQ